jgi:hypothetical protein
MKEENPVYVRLSYDEALLAKRDVLSLQGDLLRIIKIIRTYKALRLQELKIKAKTYRKIKELILNIKKIKTELPKIKTRPIKREENPIRDSISKSIDKDENNDLEDQLQEIQAKLRSIGG